jgi:flagellar motor component MotA
MFMRGCVRLCLFLLVTLISFIGSGGHIHILWQPFEILMIVGLYLVALFGAGIRFKGETLSLENRFRVVYAGKVGLLTSLIVPPLLGVIFSMAYLSDGLELLGKLAASCLAGIYWAIAFYYAFFAGLEYFDQKAKTTTGTVG